MKEEIRKGLLAGLGAIDLSLEKAGEVMERLVERGEITAEQGKKVIGELAERGRKDSAELRRKLDDAVRGALKKVTVVTKPQLDKLEKRLSSLEKRVAGLQGKSSGKKATRRKKSG
ncbi:MAG: phasin family protein [Planctomycetota bacterium]|jgi:polyhydroxyalkanoate synthesis regulator phasin